jgi:multiple sugar transport system permease protein
MIKRHPLEKAALTVLTALAFAFFMLPIFWLVTTSFKFGRDAFAIPPQWFFFEYTLKNFVQLFEASKTVMFVKNSLIITISATLLSLLLGVPAGYAIARSKSRLLNSTSYFFLIILMIPPVAMLIPFYLIMRDLGMLGTYWAVIILDTLFDASFVVWMMRSYFADVPKEMEEAALVDGASKFTAFVRVALPLSVPGIISSAIYCIIFSWNDFLFALMLTNPKTKTIPLGILASFSAIEISWGQMAAMSMVAIIPAIIISLLLNKYFVQGLTMGASKG